MKPLEDLERHRVMMPYAKLHKWALWHVCPNRWTKDYWDEYESVKNGAKPSLIAKDTAGRKKYEFVATKGKTVLTGGRKELGRLLGCHHNTISQSAEMGRKFNGFKIVKL